MQPSAPGGSSATTSAAMTAAQRAVVDAAIARLRELPGALLPILHDVQEHLGFVPPSAIATIADGLNLSQAEVHGVITFYHDFRTAPPGRHVLKVCRAEACQAMGSVQLEQRLQQRLGVGSRATSADGAVTVEPVYCLGNCALAPSVQIDGKVHGRVTAARLDALLASMQVAARPADGCCGGGCS